MEFYDMPVQGAVISTAPITEYYLASDIPWENNYEHVRLFGSQTELLNYVISKCPSAGSPYHVTDSAPISPGKMRVRIPASEGIAYNLNYIAFNNKGIVNKWYFAFITNTTWLSDNSCEITFEYDIFQCCAYDVDYKPCFVVRDHVPKSEDTYGANLIDDSVETGEMYAQESGGIGFGDLGIMIMESERLSSKEVIGQLIGNVYSGAELIYLEDDPEGASMEALANGVISAYNDAGKIDAILDMYMCPKLCQSGGTIDVAVDASNLFGGYTPKNNKLYTYPYCYVLVDNNIGQTATYKYECDITHQNNIKFSARGELCPLPAVSLRTNDYQVEGISYLDSMSYTAFPQCSWSSDLYRAWAAQNKNTIALETQKNAFQGIISGAQGAANGAASGGAAGAISGAVSGIIGGTVTGFTNQASLMAQAKDRAIEPNQIHGKASSINLNSAIGMLRFSYYKMSCSYDNARAIDDYWQQWGYPARCIRAPHLNSRSSWNFVQTSNCGFDGNVPVDMLSKFRDIFNRGVTIWHTNDIGNYGLPNN